MNPLHSTTCFADHACQRSALVAENVPLARDTYRLRLDCPEIAERIVPGQFVMVRLAEGDDPLLGRPLALYDTALDAQGRPRQIDLVYLVIGKATRRLAALTAGQRLEMWGPLGNGFAPLPVEHLIIAAGGIGQTPFVAVAREMLGQRRYGKPARPVQPARRVTLCYGVRTREFLAGLEDFQRLGVETRVSTDDGSAGHQGLVTDLIEQLLAKSDGASRRIVCCGPEPMMEAVAYLAARAGVPCEVSLETPMACGVGICFSCVARVREAAGWDYRRTCVEGPVFDAQQIVW